MAQGERQGFRSGPVDVSVNGKPPSTAYHDNEEQQWDLPGLQRGGPNQERKSVTMPFLILRESIKAPS